MPAKTKAERVAEAAEKTKNRILKGIEPTVARAERFEKDAALPGMTPETAEYLQNRAATSKNRAEIQMEVLDIIDAGARTVLANLAQQ